MSFFELPPEEVEEDEDWTKPTWAGPASDELGVEVPLHVVVGESAMAVVVLLSVTAYAQGLTLHVAARSRHPPRPIDPDDDALDRHHEFFEYSNPRSEKFVRLGVEFADGRKVTNLLPEPSWWGVDRAEPEGPVLLGHPDTNGGHGSVDLDYWLWPLPPPDRLRVVCEWRSENIIESSAYVELAAILEAASRDSERLW